MAPAKMTQVKTTQAKTTQEPREAIRDHLLMNGFEAVGFCRPEISTQAKANLRSFIKRGYHGDMGWLADKIDRRIDPSTLLPNVRTAIVVATNYGPDHSPMDNLTARECGNISVYARHRDYHDIMKKRLKIAARWLVERYACQARVFVDTAPVLEKHLAWKAGLGWQGKHTNLVSSDWGSWLFLGEIMTDLKVETSQPTANHCGSCSACLSVCPTNAFPAPYRLDARRCISYLTIEHKGVIPYQLRPAMGNRIYGCDDCLAVCPWNKFARRTQNPLLAARYELNFPKLAQLAELDDASFRRMFAGSPIKRIGRARFIRNVMIAIGNSSEPKLIPWAKRRLHDDSALVRGAAVWALSRLVSKDTFAAHRARLAHLESDSDVKAEWDREFVAP